MFKIDEVPLSQLSNLYPYQTTGMMYSSAPGFFLVSPSLGDLVVIITIKVIGRVGLEHSVREREIFCESAGHLVKDCEKMKMAKGK